MIRLCLLLVALLCPFVNAQQAPATRPTGEVPGDPTRGGRVLIVSVDGLRTDLALLGDMPNVRGLLKAGTFTFWAKTTDVGITLPSHTSMLTGVTPARHGITWNDDGPDGDTIRYPDFPTLFELARTAGYTTALVGAKSKFAPLTKPGTLDFPDVPGLGKSQRRNDEVATRAADLITKQKPQVMMVHLADVDRAGHSSGWSSPAQMEAIASADAAIGKVLAALRAAGVYDQTLIIVTADHGGYGRTHGNKDSRSAFIPWICVGPGVRRGYDLTRTKEVAVRTEDTFATACHFLSLTPAADIDGHWVEAAWQKDELLTDAPAAEAKPKRK